MSADPAGIPCRLFCVDGESFAYDPGSNRVVAVDAALRRALESGADTAELRRARARDGLFLPATPEILPAPDLRTRPPDLDSGLQQLTLSLSERCNLRCAYCPHTRDLDWVRPHGAADMPPETAVAAVRYFLERSARTARPSISLYGGEPLLAAETLRAAVAEVRRFGREDVRLIVDTNGTLLDGPLAEELVSARVELQVSLDGPAAVHDRWRRGRDDEPTHAQILEGLRRLVRLDPDVGERMRYQVTLMPGVDVLETAEWFRRPPLGGSVGASHAALDAGTPDALSLTAADAARTAESLDRARAVYVDACATGRHADLSPVLHALFDPGLIRWYHAPRTPQPPRWVGGASCTPGLRRLHVRADGVYQPCERVGEGMALGDVASGLDPEAIEGLERRFHTALADRCAGCWARRQCSLCFAALAAGVDDAGRIPEALCDGARAAFEDVLRLWVELLRRGPRSLDHLKGSSVA